MSQWNRAIGRLFALLCLSAAVWTLTLILAGRHLVAPSSPLPASFHGLFPNASRLIDLPAFRYLINSRPCRPRGVRLLTLVHSAPANGHLRDAIRRSWGATRPTLQPPVTVVFLLGAVRDRQTQRALEEESRLNGDVVQGNFLDSYRNLTYKHVMGLKWMVAYCPQARMMMKMDDDIYVHLFRLEPLTSEMKSYGRLYCYVQRNMPVVRDIGSKWYVSREEYPGAVFPNYCSGWAYLAGISVVRKLVWMAQQFPYFWVDDVHVTGTLARAAKIPLQSLNGWYSLEAESLARWAGSRAPLEWKYVFGPNQGDSSLTIRAHLKALGCRSAKCACCFGASNHSTTPAPTPKNFGVAHSVKIG